MRQGRNARQSGSKSNELSRGHRSVPVIAVRRGTNLKKDQEQIRTRKRIKRAGILHGTWNFIRKAVLLGSVMAVLGALGWGGYHIYERNGFLILRQVDVVGNSLLPKSTILEKAGLELGVKLTSIPVGQIAASLHTLPGIGDVEVKRIYPSRIEIRIKEKDPIAMGFSKGWYGLASDGTRISGLDWESSDLPVVDGFAKLDSTHLAALGTFLKIAKENYPGIYANFSQLSLQGKGDGVAEIILRDGRLKVLVNVKEAVEKAVSSANENKTNSNKSLNSLEFLQALMHQQSTALAPGNTIDLRVDGLAYVH